MPKKDEFFVPPDEPGPAEPHPPKPSDDDPPAFNYDRPTILLEDGATRQVATGVVTDREGRDWRVLHDGVMYEHCATHVNGRWIYRPVK